MRRIDGQIRHPAADVGRPEIRPRRLYADAAGGERGGLGPGGLAHPSDVERAEGVGPLRREPLIRTGRTQFPLLFLLVLLGRLRLLVFLPRHVLWLADGQIGLHRGRTRGDRDGGGGEHHPD
jgi:hypothetical protein